MNSLGISFIGLASAVLFLALGLFAFGVLLRPFVRMLTEAFRREILEEKNLALAVLAGSISLSLSIIIAAAVH